MICRAIRNFISKGKTGSVRWYFFSKPGEVGIFKANWLRMRLLTIPMLFVVLVACKGRMIKTADDAQAVNYVADTVWPQTSVRNEIGQPTGIGVDTNDHIFVFHRAGRRWTDPFPDSSIANNTIMELDAATGNIISSWGGGYFIMPHGLTVDHENNIWVTDVGLHQVFKFSHDGTLLLQIGEAKIPGNDSAHFNLPTDVAVAADGSFFVSDGYGNSRVVKFSKDGRFIKAWGSFGAEKGEFNIPHGITITQDTLYVADRQNNRIQLFDTTGRFLMELKNDVQVQQLPSVALNKTGRLFAVDYDPTLKKDSTVNGSTVFTFNEGLQVSGRFGAMGAAERTTCWFHDLAIDSKGNVYVGDIYHSRLIKFKPVK